MSASSAQPAAAAAASTPGPRANGTDHKDEFTVSRATVDFMSRSHSAPRVGYADAPSRSAEDRESVVLLRTLASEEDAANAGAAIPKSQSIMRLGTELIVEKLCAGSIFLKHSFKQHGADFRAVWCNPDMSEIRWGPLNKSKVNGTIKVIEIREIKAGHASPAFDNAKKQRKHALKEENCFTISAVSRSLDLECFSKGERDMWILAFKFIVRRSGNKEVLNTLDVEEKKLFTPAVLANEVQVLTHQLAERDAHIQRLETALQNSVKHDTTGVEAMAPGALDAKLGDEVKFLRAELNKATARVRQLEASNEQMLKERDDLRRDTLLLQDMVDGKVPNSERNLQEEVVKLRIEVKLHQIRESVRIVNTQAEYLKLLEDVNKTRVPVALLPAPEPHEETSEEEDSDDEKAEPSASKKEKAPGPAGAPAAPSSQLFKKHLHEVLTESEVSVNGEKFTPADQPGKSVIFLLEKLAALVAERAVPTIPIDQARMICTKLVTGLNMTRSNGDAYAALTWMVGHHDLVVITPEHRRVPLLEFKVDDRGLQYVHKHFFKICGSRSMGGDFDEKEVLWSHAVGAVVKKITYRELTNKWEIPLSVSLTFGKFKGKDGSGPVLLPRVDPQDRRDLSQIEKQLVAAGGNPNAAAPAAAAPAPAAAAAAAPAKAAEEKQKLKEMRIAERNKVTAASSQPNPKPGEPWYIINNKWVDQWKKFVSGGKVRPGPISNDELLNKDGSPKPNMQLGADYRAVTKVAWDAFFELYGGGPVITRENGKL